MKYNAFIIGLLSIFSCNSPNNEENSTDKTKYRKIDPILEALISKYPNYIENTIVRENATKELDKKIDSILHLGYLNDIPLRVFKMEKNPLGKGALVQFYTDNYKVNQSNKLSDRLNFDIIGFMDEKLASTLSESGTYFIYGNKLKRLDETDLFLGDYKVYFSPETAIKEDVFFHVYNFNIGDISCQIDSVKLVSK